MAFNFPDSPTPGQVFQKWTWNGEAWVLTAPVNSAANTTFAPTGDIVATNVQAAIVEVDAEMHAADALLAPLASPVFTGDPRAPTPAAADNDTSIATTAFVKAAIPTSYPYLPLAGGTVTGELVAGTGYIRMTTSGTGGYFQWGGGGAYNCGGQTIYHSGNFAPSSYLSNGRLPYAGDAPNPNSYTYVDLLANAKVSGIQQDFTTGNINGHRMRYVQGYTTGWFTFAYA